MLLENITLANFKNYENLELSFSKEVNAIVGANGSGKTNLLDAIYYLSMARSAFISADQKVIRRNELFFSVRGNFQVNDKDSKVHCAYQIGQKKIVKKDNKPYEKLSEHIGSFPVVLVTPYDTDLIREGSETRRRFFDAIISQLDRGYLEVLILYKKLLKQRNSALRQFATANSVDFDLLASYDNRLLPLCQEISNKRKSFIEGYKKVFETNYKMLSDQKESVSLEYKSKVLEDSFEETYKSNIQRDVILQRTDLGIHKDDFTFTIDDFPIKTFGSQGQQKSYVIALKLAQFEIIKESKNLKPLLLLDDIFDKLDDHRIHQLVAMVANNTFGQIFITDARPERTQNISKSLKKEINFIHIGENGDANPES